MVCLAFKSTIIYVGILANHSLWKSRHGRQARLGEREGGTCYFVCSCVGLYSDDQLVCY